MTRRLILSLFMLVPLATSGCTDPDVEVATRPAFTAPRHIVLFVIDTLRADRLNSYGYADRTTSPVIDRLAAEGVLFEAAYAPAPWTLPSLVSIATSSYVCEHKVTQDRNRLSDDEVTLAEILRDTGFTTVGLYGNGYAGPDFGLDQGFRRYRFSRRNDGAKVAPVLDALGEGERLFLYIHNMEPHGGERFTGPEIEGFPPVSKELRDELNRHFIRYRKLTRWDFARSREPGATDNTVEQQAELAFHDRHSDANSVLYDAAIRLGDQRLGSVIRELKARDMWDDTLFLLISDHGEELGDHGGWQHDQSAYEELLRVPLIIKLPAAAAAGRRIQNPVSLVSLLPTVLNLLEVEPVAAVAGRSLLPFIAGATPTGPDDAWQVVGMRENRKKYYRPWKERRGDLNIALRRSGYKGIWNLEVETAELYNLATDPGEHADLAATEPRLTSDLVEAAEAFLTACRQAATQGPEASKLSEETKDRLRALGYLD